MKIYKFEGIKYNKLKIIFLIIYKFLYIISNN